MRDLPDRLLYGAFRLGGALLRSLPPEAAQVVGRLAGRVWWICDARHRRRVHENLRACFSESMSERERAALVPRTFENMTRVLVDTMWFERLLATTKQFQRRCRMHGAWDAFQADAQAGQPGLLVSAHLGVWEVAPYLMRTLPVRFSSVVRPIDNPYIDADIRARRGAVMPHRSAAAPMRAALRRGEWVGLALDQNAGRRGRYVPFFGMVASTAGAPMAFAIRAGAPIWLGVAIRTQRALAYDIHVERLTIPADTPSSERTEAYLAAYHSRLEHYVRMAPAEYNWLHRRWKDRPRGEAPNPRLPVYDHHR